MSQTEPNPILLKHPWSWIAESARLSIFVSASTLAIALTLVLALQGAPLQTDLSPKRIVSFELAGDLATSQKMMAAWGEPGRIAASFNLGLDYLYMVVYALAIGLGCIVVAPVLAHRFRAWPVIGWGLSWALVIAALADAIENYCLTQLLMGRSAPALAIIARWAALLKFTLVGLGLIYVVSGLLVAGWGWLKARRSPVR